MQIKLISLLTSCGLKVDDSSLGEVIETHLNQAAQARYRSLKATIGKPRGAARNISHVSDHKAIPRDHISKPCMSSGCESSLHCLSGTAETDTPAWDSRILLWVCTVGALHLNMR